MNDSDFIEALDSQIAAIMAEMAADPRIKKLEQLRALRALYSGVGVTEAPKPFQKAKVAPDASKPGRSMSPERAEALAKAKDILRGRSMPFKTAQIYAIMTENGFEIPGSNPENVLAQLLGRDPEVQTHGRKGWTLVSETPEATDDLISRSASMASNSSVSDQPDNPQ